MSDSNFLRLPDEILAHVFGYLTAVDLTRIRLVCRRYNDVVGEYAKQLWSRASLAGIWIDVDDDEGAEKKGAEPLAASIIHKCADYGNLEALLKRGLAILYARPNFSKSSSCYSNCSGSTGCLNELACDQFSLVDTLHSHEPFTWLLYRPPWAQSHCSKSALLKHLTLKCGEREQDARIVYNVAKALLLLEGNGTDDFCDQKADASRWMETAAAKGSAHASYQLWKMTFDKFSESDPGMTLRKIRWLRECAACGCLDAQIELGLYYAKSQLGGISHQQGIDYIKNLALMAKERQKKAWTMPKSRLTTNMRYILCDWLFEVGDMKQLPSRFVHCAMHVVDEYTSLTPVHRSQLQLTGITALVLITRFLGQEVVTIKEAAWLTDNTYKYGDVVRTMGEILGVLKGRIRVATVLDYLDIYAAVARVRPLVHTYACYLCDLALLWSLFKSSSLLAISCLVLSLATVHRMDTSSIAGFEVPFALQQCSPFSLDSIWACAAHVVVTCLQGEPVLDHKSVPLKSVYERYSRSDLFNVVQFPTLTVEDLSLFIDWENSHCLSTSLDSSTDISSSQLQATFDNQSSFLTESFGVNESEEMDSAAGLHDDENLENDSAQCKKRKEEWNMQEEIRKPLQGAENFLS